MKAIKFTVTLEVDINRDLYPKDFTDEQIIAHEKENLIDTLIYANEDNALELNTSYEVIQ